MQRSSNVLDIPNLEVKEAFFTQLTAGFVEKGYSYTENSYMQIREALKTGDLQSILEIIKSIFASIPYQLHVNAEAYYHSIFFSIMNVLGFNIDAEVSVLYGRIDAVLELQNNVYVFEFKYETCPLEADVNDKKKIFEKALKNGMKQINEKGYANKYKGSGKTIYQAVFAFLGRDSIEMESSVTFAN